MNLDKKEAQKVVYEEHEDYEEVKREITGTSRWSVNYMGVFYNDKKDKYYKTHWSVGATEQQSERPFEYGDAEFVEVLPKEVEVKKYVEVDNDEG